MVNRRTLGSGKEDEAARYLAEQGLNITDRNFRCRTGEIDLVARDGEYVVFVEVKYRKNASAGYPEEAVNYSKARTISRTADHYRLFKKLSPDTMIRFDVVAIEGGQIRWYKDAFPYTT